MAIAREFHGKGWTVDQFDELNRRLIANLGLAPGQGAPGVLFHWSSVTDDGMRVVDVYESKEAADRLAQDQIGPLAGELGLTPPNITEYEVHAYLSTL
jgi:hypothetical protein